MKKITKDDADALVIEVSSRMAVGCGLAALFFTFYPVSQRLLQTPLSEDRLIGFIGGAVTCGLIYLVLYEKVRFVFDSKTRLLTWRRRRSLSSRQGTVPFAMIDRVVLRSCIGNSRYAPKERVVLLTREGELPLSIAYEHDEMNQILADGIRRRLGMALEDLVTDSVQLLVERGETIEAIRLLREKQGLSLTEAKGQVDRMRARKKE